MTNYTAPSDLESHFDKTASITQNGKEIEYGIIDGSSTIIFIKAGLKGSCFGYENKYVKIGRALNEKHGCSIISSSNPLGTHTDFDLEMDFVRNYAEEKDFTDYQVYYLGYSNGASLGISSAYRFPEIKKLVCINGPLMRNPLSLLRGIKNFSGEKMYLVYGSKDPSFNLLKLYSNLKSDKIDFVRLFGVDHYFTGCLNLFIELPGILFFGDELSGRNVKICQ